jgi:hypothetical protein
MVLVESNLGDGMFSALLTPVLHKIYPCRIEEIRHNIQKEKRICDVLEPVMNSHKLCISRRVIEDDFKSTQDLPADQAIKYQLMYQLSRVTRLRGALRHDDRLDALSMAVQWHVEAMKRDTDRQMADHKAEILDKEIEKFLNGVFGRKNRDGHTWLRR